jgi:hypothetical protein
MSEQTSFRQFAVERRVMRMTKEQKLSFVSDLRRVARHQNVSLDASLNFASVELVREGVMRDITLEHPVLTYQLVHDTIERELAAKNVAGLGYMGLKLELGDADVFAPPHEPEWIGIHVIDSRNILAHNGQVISQVLSAEAGMGIDLPESEYFLNLGRLSNYSPTGLDEVLDHIDRKKPQSIDVYDVSVRAAGMYTP